MRRRQMRWLRDRFKEFARMKPKRDALLMKLGAARQQAKAWRLFEVAAPASARGRKKQKDTTEPPPALTWRLRWDQLCEARRHEGRYLKYV